MSGSRWVVDCFVFLLVFCIFATMDYKEAIKKIGVTRAALSNYVRQGKIRVGRTEDGRYDYNPSDVDRLSETKGRWQNKWNPSEMESYAEGIIARLGYDLAVLRSSARKRELVDQRRVVANVLTRLGMGRTDIGKVLNRDHSTVIQLLGTSYLSQKEIDDALTELERMDYGKEKKTGHQENRRSDG